MRLEWKLWFHFRGSPHLPSPLFCSHNLHVCLWITYCEQLTCGSFPSVQILIHGDDDSTWYDLIIIRASMILTTVEEKRGRERMSDCLISIILLYDYSEDHHHLHRRCWVWWCRFRTSDGVAQVWVTGPTDCFYRSRGWERERWGGGGEKWTYCDSY